MVALAVQKQMGDLSLQLDISLRKGEFVSLYGTSGAGKTSALRMIAGFLKPDSGNITIHEHAWFDSERQINMTPQRRKVGFVFQDYALFPNMTVRENIAFAATNNDVVEELLDVTGLAALSARRPQHLSGGQKQRVALARAIAMQPALLLLDEPLNAIDREMRVQLQDTLLQVHQRYGLTTMMVSHDVEEIVKLSDRVIHLENGKTRAYASPAELLQWQEGVVTAVQQEGSKTYVTIALDTQQGNVQVGDKMNFKK